MKTFRVVGVKRRLNWKKSKIKKGGGVETIDVWKEWSKNS